MTKHELFTTKTESLIFGLQPKPIQRMLDFDYVCSRENPSVKAIIQPGRTGFHKCFFGKEEILIPVYPDIKSATKECPKADVLINFASFRSAYETSKEAIENKNLKTVVVIAEGIPERKTAMLIALAKEKKKTIIGPATVGGLKAGTFKIGNTGGTIENMVDSKLLRPGSVGLVTKSGGLSNEMFKVIALHTDGINEGIAIGGDRFPGSTLYDHVMRFEKNPDIKIIVVLGEVGGQDEIEIAKAIAKKKIKKPVVAWVTGTCAKMFGSEVQFGHAGAKSGSELESADAKNKELKKAGAIVPKSFDDFGEQIGKVFEKLKLKISPDECDYSEYLKDITHRHKTHIISSISDDRGEEAVYNGHPISEVVEKHTLGDTIALLWFKKKLPSFATTFIEMVLKTVADHGPAVSGAHNAIVTARAGKDLVSSLCSGLLTVGPRFGGAIDGAACYFKHAKDRGLTPIEFVKEMKQKNINIPGIGHKIKSVKNPDKRVETLKIYANKNFRSLEYLEYALEVEAITTSKKDNLILNVDGCIAVLFLDLLKSCPQFTKTEIDEFVETGYLNGLFVLGRSIGIMGHVFDQKRLKQGLYRHPWEDILYLRD